MRGRLRMSCADHHPRACPDRLAHGGGSAAGEVLISERDIRYFGKTLSRAAAMEELLCVYGCYRRAL